MSLLNYTTKKKPEETISEIQQMLSQFDVTAMMTEYEGRQVSAVSFRMNVDGRDIGYRLPCNWRAVFSILQSDVKDNRYNTEEQAIRTAWRIIHHWMEAQLALVEVNMTTIPQIFLPYTIMRDNRTLSEHIASNPTFLLDSGSKQS